MNYSWPGNVRELENEVKRAVILAEEDVIEKSNLSEHVRGVMSRNTLYRVPTEESTQFLRGTVEEIEIQKIKEVLEKSGGNKQKASKILGITRQGLIYKNMGYLVILNLKSNVKIVEKRILQLKSFAAGGS
jgi:transcriptional regulator with PAS, ATPase and Fis domain